MGGILGNFPESFAFPSVAVYQFRPVRDGILANFSDFFSFSNVTVYQFLPVRGGIIGELIASFFHFLMSRYRIFFLWTECASKVRSLHFGNYATKSIDRQKKPRSRDYSSVTSCVPIILKRVTLFPDTSPMGPLDVR